METSAISPRDTVVVALDGSPAAIRALPVARALAKCLDCRLEIMHVLPGGDHPSDWRPPGAHERAGTRIRVRRDDSADAILRTAADARVALVVMTTHGGAIGGAPRLGCVAERVIAEATCPIMFVRPEAAPGASEALGAGHLLLPLDGAPTTLMALGPVADLARRLDAPLDLLFVASGERLPEDEPGAIGIPQLVDQPQHAWPEWQVEVVEQLSICSGRNPLGVPARAFVAAGPVSEAILRFAQTNRDSMIGLVRRSPLEPGHGAILREVLTHAPCPVLVTGVAAAWSRKAQLRLALPHPLRPHGLQQGA